MLPIRSAAWARHCLRGCLTALLTCLSRESASTPCPTPLPLIPPLRGKRRCREKKGKCSCHMSQGSWQMSRRDMTSPHPNPWQMSRHVAMFPHFLLTGGPDGVSAVKKSAQKRKNSFLSPKSLRDGMEMARNTHVAAEGFFFVAKNESIWGLRRSARPHHVHFHK